MINNVKEAITNQLLELYPAAEGYTVFNEDNSQNFVSKSFLVTLVSQKYSKQVGDRYKGELSFDIAYFSDKEDREKRVDCLNIQLGLFREFDLIGTYRVLDKQAVINENVLHFSFQINYYEVKIEEEIKMQKQKTTTSI
ncbi:phage tail terminator family protein [Anaeromicropila populeti]|uniref:Uncharacterized protein n=1 Tax=Anaeromicropila populeti TaxID=37658 RepID=A0A1I6JHQ4_9FIRM|nr:hypothetical protein [Anaeromicropila populeti]SFR78537.1 hypothetical protein SAMN05661086_01702 [Anaeromicropila populeti]